MNLYGIEIALTGEELCVAARDFDHGAQVFVTFWIARTGSAPGNFSIGAGAPQAYLDHETVEIVAQGDVAGVIVRQTDGSMLFDPAIGR